MSAAVRRRATFCVVAENFGGKPIRHDMSIAVEHVFGTLAPSENEKTILGEHPALGPEDTRASLLFAQR